ncbi:MAG: HIT family protein [Deltaproteobacteria bacterium]|nr:HIT family protein [Deltaproteobacteria bacterium]
MPTLFTRIIEGELPARFVWKDERAVAFLTIEPLRPGHTLVVPRQEVDHWLDADGSLRDHLMAVCHAVGRAIERAYRPPKVGLLLAGLEVPHLHVHVFPLYELADIDIAKVDRRPRPEDLDDAAEKIRTALGELGYSAVSR